MIDEISLINLKINQSILREDSNNGIIQNTSVAAESLWFVYYA